METQITKNVNVTVVIQNEELLDLLVGALSEGAERATGKESTLYRALSFLVGCSDVEAVKLANRRADNHMQPRVKVDEFRRWLPVVLSRVFAKYAAEKEAE